MWRVGWLLVLLTGGCTVAGIERVQEDLEILKMRVAAREEVRISVAGATTSGQLQSPIEPHVTVGTPPCPPAVAQSVAHRHASKARRHRATHRGRR